MKKLFLFVLALLMTANVAASTLIDGLYYNLNGSGATVTYKSLSSNGNYVSGDVVIPATITYGGSTYTVNAIDEQAFKSCTALTGVTIPLGVKTIGASAFRGCIALASVEFDASSVLDSIAEKAFYGTNALEHISLPASVRFVGFQAICLGGIKTISVLAVVPPILGHSGDYYDNFWDSSYKTAQITVPGAGFADYLVAEGWTRYSTKITADVGIATVKFYDKWPGYGSGEGDLIAIDPVWNGSTIVSGVWEQRIAIGYSATAPSPYWAESDSKYPFGQTAYYHYGYTWAGWDQDFSHVTEDMNVHTRYVANPYTVTFKNDNDTVLETALFEFGAIPFYSKGIPYKAQDAEYSYEFLGWRSATNDQVVEILPAVMSNETYTAVYRPVDRRYVIIFEDEDGNILQQKEYSKNALPVYEGVEPAKAGLTFAGWTPNITAATADATYRPVFKARVIFNDEWGNEWQNSLWEVGATPVYSGATPTHDATAQYSFEFQSWPTISAATQNVTYTAVFSLTLRKYNIIFKVVKNFNETVVQQEQLEYGAMPEYKGEPLDYEESGYIYHHVGWEPEIQAVTSDETYVAIFSSVPLLTVYFYDCDGVTLLKTEKVQPGQDATAPTESQQPGSIITGWDKEFTNVQNNLNVYAECILETYTVTLIAENGTIAATDDQGQPVDVSQPVAYGTMLTLVATGNEGYVFDKWNDDLTENTRQLSVLSDITLTAYFVPSTEGFENIISCENAAKVLIDGQIYILRGDRTYTTTGAEITER